jgi:hypothetical protein
VQQLSGGIASMIAGVVVSQGPGGDLRHFDELGYIVVATTLVSLGLMYFVQKAVAEASPPLTPADTPGLSANAPDR